MVLINTIEIIHFLIKYHPHQSVYFNVLAGDVEKNFERDYYGVSYKKALTQLLSQETEDTLRIYSQDYTGKINVMNFTKTDAQRIKFVDRIEDANYFISLFNPRYINQLDINQRPINNNDSVIIDISIKNYSLIKILKLNK
ncbi:MAG: hypothetical protein C0433_14235 [Cyclobacterium sp.]|nr:hypothetical protein [Cyclobacterium sp.]